MTIDRKIIEAVIMLLYKLNELEACEALLKVAKRRFGGDKSGERYEVVDKNRDVH